MKSEQTKSGFNRLIKILCMCCFVFFSPASYATYYGGHHYRPYHHHYPYYGHHYRYHRGHHSHYGAHAYVSGDAALVVLGVLGVALLTHTITNNYKYHKRTYPKTYSYTQPKWKLSTTSAYYKKPVKPVTYRYSNDEGWKQLARGNANYALDIFAIQSQQNLHSGEPKLGFAIAAATLGEKDRAVRAMRKAVRIDANALNSVNIDAVKPEIRKMAENYQSTTDNQSFNTDTAFMMATLSYLQQDFATANSFIDKNDRSQSANNLRELLKRKL